MAWALHTYLKENGYAYILCDPNHSKTSNNNDETKDNKYNRCNNKHNISRQKLFFFWDSLGIDLGWHWNWLG